MASKTVSSFLAPKADVSAFPEPVVQSLQTVAVDASSAILDAQAALPSDKPESQIELPHAMKMIIDALDDFDPRLGRAARNVFNQSERLNIHAVPEGKGVMMRVRPAGLEEKNAMSIDGHKDIKRLRDAFPFDHNKDNDFSVIDFEYDRSIHSVIYLAHELGHAIADDYQLASRHTYRDNPKHMEETQAYLVQTIVTAALQAHTNPEIAGAARRHFADEMAGQVYAYPLAQIATSAMESASKGEPVCPAVLFQAGFGENWPSVAEKNYHGKQLFGALESVNTAQQEGRAPEKDDMDKLHGAIDRLHDRPTSQLVAVGIAASLQGQEQEIKSKISEMVLGLYGPKTLSDVLDEAGVTSRESMERFMKSTIEAAVQPLHKHEANPPMLRPSKPHATAKTAL